ncbi:MAG: recombinase family protein [Cyanobacteriota/Melainabacteria group bacterium]
MKIGYARVSSDDQNLALQLDALRKSGCKRVFEDTRSGATADRPGLIEMLATAKKGDVVVVWRLDRLGRSLQDLLKLSSHLEKAEVGLISLQENLGTTTSGGKLLFHFLGAMAEFEANLIRERTAAGLAAAKARGRVGGRPKLLDAKQRKAMIKLHKSGEYSVSEICRMMNISRPTFYNYLEEAGQ